MNDSMRKIVEADALGRKALETAQKNRDALPIELEQARKDIFSQYEQQANQTIQKAKADSEKQFEVAKQEISEKIAKQEAQLKERFSKNKDVWEAQILEHILGK